MKMRAFQKSLGILGVIALVSSGVFGSAHFALAADKIPIANFSEIAPGIYRGGAPDDAGTAYLASIKLKTDVDLESFRWPVIWDEESDDKAVGIQLVSEPLLSLPGIFSIIQPSVSNRRINKILSLMSDPANYPIYIHCQKGEDRTGLVVGLYRVLIQKWSPEDAWAEMLKFGYHPYFEQLTKYFEKRTHWKPEAEPETEMGDHENNATSSGNVETR
jgi:protein tyrosine/serine phosphatase